MRECGDHLAFDRDSVLVDFPVECLAESDEVFVAVVACGLFGLVVVEPKPHPIEEVKAGSINQAAAVGLVFGPKEDGGGKDTMEALHDAAIMAAVLGKAEEVEHLSGALETNDAALLLNGEGRDPDGNETVLAEGQAEFGMSGDVEKELAVASRMNQLGARRPAERNTAENEGSGMVGKLLLAILPFLADEGDSFELTKPELCDAEGRKSGLKRQREWTLTSVGPGGPAVGLATGSVPKVYQIGRKGVAF